MKVSLVSATSLGALLAFEVMPAHAQIFTLNQPTLGFGNSLVNCAAFAGCVANTLTEAVTLDVTSSHAGTLVFGSAATPFSGSKQKSSSASGYTSGTTVSNAYTFAPTVKGQTANQTISVTATLYSGTTKDTQTANVTVSGTGVAPVQSISASNNGYVLVKSSDTATVTVNNIGNGNTATYWNGTSFVSVPTSVSNLNGSITAVNGTGFSGTTSASVSLNDSTSTSYTYTYAPTAKGATATSKVTLKFSDGNSAGTNTTQTVIHTLTGTGVAPVATIDGGGGYALVGNTGTVSLTVQNTGNGNLSGAGTVSNLHGVIGSASGLFSGSAVALGNGSGLTDGSTQAIDFTFAPTDTGTFSAAVTGSFTNGIGNANDSGTETATLTGTGVAPVATLDFTNADYALVNSPAATSAATVTIANIGNGDLAGADSFMLQTNLHGSQGAASSSVFAGAGASINLQDPTAGGATTSTVFGYDFAPTARGAASAVVTTSFTNGIGKTNGTGTYTTTLTGTGVAPVNSVTSTNAGTVRIGSSATAAVTITNIGNGNLATGGRPNSISNLDAASMTGPASGSPFVAKAGNATSLSLADAGSAVLSYVYAPSAHGSSSTAISIAFSNGNSAGTNLSQTVQATITGTGAGPTYQSKLGRTIDTPIANGGTAHASTINFGTVGAHATETLDLDISNISTDPNGGNAALTDLTLLSVSSPAGGNDPLAFTIGSYGSLLTEGGQIYLPITLTTDGQLGLLDSFLSITTDQDAALGQVGDTFDYVLNASAVPEPASLIILGVGFAGLGLVRRQRTKCIAGAG